MTIETFNWGDFWASAWSASWCEIGALVALAFLWRRLRNGKTGADATDVSAFFLLASAFALTTLSKLFNDLDVVALGWAALTLGTALDYWKARSRRRRELQAAELERRKAEAARRRDFWGGSDSSAESSRRRRHSRRSGRGESERSSSSRSRRSESSRSRRGGDSSSSSDKRSGE